MPDSRASHPAVLAWLAAERPLLHPPPASADPAVAAAAVDAARAASAPAVRESDEVYVMFTDADMLFREPIDPVALGARRGAPASFLIWQPPSVYGSHPSDSAGVVVSAEYTYLVGTESGRGFAKRFIAEDLVPRLAQVSLLWPAVVVAGCCCIRLLLLWQVGGFHIFHREDLRAIAPLWLEYTKRVRAFADASPTEFFAESADLSEVAAKDLPTRKKQSRWHSEMYGYVFAAAIVGVTHRVRRDVMLYPGCAHSTIIRR